MPPHMNQKIPIQRGSNPWPSNYRSNAISLRYYVSTHSLLLTAPCIATRTLLNLLSRLPCAGSGRNYCASASIQAGFMKATFWSINHAVVGLVWILLKLFCIICTSVRKCDRQRAVRPYYVFGFSYFIRSLQETLESKSIALMYCNGWFWLYKISSSLCYAG